jgi:hypothetical protein
MLLLCLLKLVDRLEEVLPGFLFALAKVVFVLDLLGH